MKNLYVEKLKRLWGLSWIGGIIVSLILSSDLDTPNFLLSFLFFVFGCGGVYFSKLFASWFGTFSLTGNLALVIGIYGLGFVIGMAIGTPILLLMSIYYIIRIILDK